MPNLTLSLSKTSPEALSLVLTILGKQSATLLAQSNTVVDEARDILDAFIDLLSEARGTPVELTQATKEEDLSSRIFDLLCSFGLDAPTSVASNLSRYLSSKLARQTPLFPEKAFVVGSAWMTRLAERLEETHASCSANPVGSDFSARLADLLETAFDEESDESLRVVDASYLKRVKSALSSALSLRTDLEDRRQREIIGYISPQSVANFKAKVSTSEWMWATPDDGLVAVSLTPSSRLSADSIASLIAQTELAYNGAARKGYGE